MKYFIAIILLHLVFFKNADCDCSISCPPGKSPVCQFKVAYNYGPVTQTSAAFTTGKKDKAGCHCTTLYGGEKGVLVCVV
uniref:Uncharacterized protein n=1 Tax=Meloidogyne enterolobii TaxID=390850 RepID=A0A6V7UL72_MELEN|nr:unnamed protein product [Meloidogyne enterolobii]